MQRVSACWVQLETGGLELVELQAVVRQEAGTKQQLTSRLKDSADVIERLQLMVREQSQLAEHSR